MARVVEIPIEPFSHEAFAPYGQAVGPLPGEPAWQRPRLTSWRMDFSCDGVADLKMIRYQHQPMAFSMLERHLNHTETRVPLMGGRFVMVVAEPAASLDTVELPDPASIRAFLIDGTVGIILWKGTWHSLDTYPAEPPHVDCAFISEKGTQAEIEVVGADPANAKLTHVVDFAPTGLSFQLVDPASLLPR